MVSRWSSRPSWPSEPRRIYSIRTESISRNTRSSSASGGRHDVLMLLNPPAAPMVADAAGQAPHAAHSVAGKGRRVSMAARAPAMTPNSSAASTLASAAFVARALPRGFMLADAGCLFIEAGFSALQLSYAGCPPRVGATLVLGAEIVGRCATECALPWRRCGVCVCVCVSHKPYPKNLKPETLTAGTRHGNHITLLTTSPLACRHTAGGEGECRRGTVLPPPLPPLRRRIPGRRRTWRLRRLRGPATPDIIAGVNGKLLKSGDPREGAQSPTLVTPPPAPPPPPAALLLLLFFLLILLLLLLILLLRLLLLQPRGRRVLILGCTQLLSEENERSPERQRRTRAFRGRRVPRRAHRRRRGAAPR